MMELLLSNYLPAKFPSTKTSKEIFERFLESADQVRIASGYISSEALIELKRIAAIKSQPGSLRVDTEESILITIDSKR